METRPPDPSEMETTFIFLNLFYAFSTMIEKTLPLSFLPWFCPESALASTLVWSPSSWISSGSSRTTMGNLVETITALRFNEFLWGFWTFSH